MDSPAQHDRTEAPSPRRREQAREEGRVAHSADLTNALVLFLAALVLRTAGPQLIATLSTTLADALSQLRGEQFSETLALVSARRLATTLLLTTGTVAAALLAAGLLANLVQVGFRITPASLAWQWERLSPVAGWARICSWDGGVKALGMAAKVTLVGGAAATAYAARHAELIRRSHAALPQAVAAAWDVTVSIATAVALAMLLWAAADYLYHWWQHERQLRMTRQELRDEHREQEGDPHLRRRMRAAQQQAALRKALQAVPQATVVVTNPTHVAVALRYEPGRTDAPRVVAKGKGALALRIMRVAREHGVPVQEAKPLARALYRRVPLGAEIPLELFQVVAELLSRLYRRRRTG